MKKFLLFFFTLFLTSCTLSDELGGNPGETIIKAYEWTKMSTRNTPRPRKQHSAVWTGSEWLVWGGTTSTGSDPDPKFRESFGDGGSFNGPTNTWTMMETAGAPHARHGHSGVWTGEELLVWGGAYATPFNDGGRYNPAKRTWNKMSEPPADIPPRYMHPALWTGNEMVVWGGFDNTDTLDTGGSYDPKQDTWEVINPTGAPSRRFLHTMNLVGRKIYIWGGKRDNGSQIDSYRADGGIYNLHTKQWSHIPESPIIQGRSYHSTVYGRKMLMVWGGEGFKDGIPTSLNDGAIYDIRTGIWRKMSPVGAPSNRSRHVAVWTGKRMLVWGGSDGGKSLRDGYLYDPRADKWETLVTPPNNFSIRYLASAVWTGNSLMIWGGTNSTRGELNDGMILMFPTQELED